MTLSPSNCHVSDILYTNGSDVADACAIEVVEILDTNKVSVKVYPLYEGRIDLIMTQGQPYDFIDFQVPFRITPTSVVYGTTHKAAQFKMCDLVKPLAFECIQGEYSLSYMGWKYDKIAGFIQGEYWALTGMDRSDSVTIARVSRDNIILETKNMLPCKPYKFSSGHEVYVTDITSGWTPNCRITVYPLRTLTIDKVLTELSPAGDLPKYNRYGVYLEVHLSGAGKGSLKLSWGTDHSETKTGIVAGNYAYVYNLPPGTHNICAELFNVV